jgi:hypothetical protein
MTVIQKQPSPELLSLIKAAAQSLLGFGELWNSIKMKGKDEGFSERELQDILRPLLKPQLNKDQIYYLFNAEQKKVQNKEHYDKIVSDNRINPTEPLKKDIEQSEIEKIGEIRRAEERRKSEEVEEPTELELANIKIAQLEDALHKTNQFRAATDLDIKSPEVTEDFEKSVSDMLRVRADGVHSFYYDAYGIDLFKNRELAQLKNSGVKTFKRLYFEV